ncbi:MAG: ABC transporter substrate-binding protein [Bacteroidales bacterium]
MVPRSARFFTASLVLLIAAIIAGVVLLNRKMVNDARLEKAGQPAASQATGRDGDDPSGGSLVSSIRGEPRTFNRHFSRDFTTESVTYLTQARLVRVNRQTLELEPALAERWTLADDGLTYTLRLRQGLKFSDGAPFSSADVLFSFRAAYDERWTSSIGDTLRVNGKPLQVTAPDADTVVVRFPAPFGPGVRILDNLPIYPQHLLQADLDRGTFAKAWGPTTPPEKIAGLGPFVLREYQPGTRLVFTRNPHYFGRDAAGRPLPYLEKVTLEIVPDGNAELLRLQAGQIDCVQSEVRAEDYAVLKQAEAQGRIRMYDLGPGLDADSLWLNLRADAKIPAPRRAWLQHPELRRAIAEAVDRKHFSDAVFLGAAEPVFGPVSPANKAWFDPTVPTPAFDRAKAEARLAGIGLRKGPDGTLVDRTGSPARITLITQKGNASLERGAAIIRDDVRAIGLVVDVVALEVGALVERLETGDFEAIYFRFLTTDLDPAMNLDFWLSSGAAHVWNRAQKRPATEWERRVDDLMTRQAALPDMAERRRLFGEVQRTFAEEMPILYFATPRVYVATSARVRNVAPSLLRPMVLWSADTLAVAK